MTQIMLSVGSALLAFGPLLFLFATIVYPKAQLMILSTTAAFFGLLAVTVTSMIYYILNRIGISNGIVGILLSVIFQFLLRCGFCNVYFSVEQSIQKSLAETATEDNNEEDESVRLKLALNDGSAAIASAVGFGGFHNLILFGSLLASETTNNVGVLFQDSCPQIPSLVVAAILANFNTILQVFWMLFTFFGTRRRALFRRGEANLAVRGIGAHFGNSRNGGNVGLLVVLLTHTAVGMLTVANSWKYGCRVSLPGVGAMVLLVAYIFWAGCGKIYLPQDAHRD